MIKSEILQFTVQDLSDKDIDILKTYVEEIREKEHMLDKRIFYNYSSLEDFCNYWWKLICTYFYDEQYKHLTLDKEE